MNEISPENIIYQNLSERKEFLPQLANWYFTEWGYEVPNRTLDVEEKDLRESLENDELPIIIIATDQETLLGAGQIKRQEMSIYPAKEYWIGGIFVGKENRGKGIAQQIIKQLLGIAKAKKMDTLYLQTEALDGGLYARLGWKGIERVNYHGTEVLVMEKDLSLEDKKKRFRNI